MTNLCFFVAVGSQRRRFVGLTGPASPERALRLYIPSAFRAWAMVAPCLPIDVVHADQHTERHAM